MSYFDFVQEKVAALEEINHEVQQKCVTAILQSTDGKCLALCLLLRHGEYWFCISRYVCDRNRPLAPILRKRRGSLMYDVF